MVLKMEKASDSDAKVSTSLKGDQPITETEASGLAGTKFEEVFQWPKVTKKIRLPSGMHCKVIDLENTFEIAKRREAYVQKMNELRHRDKELKKQKLLMELEEKANSVGDLPYIPDPRMTAGRMREIAESFCVVEPKENDGVSSPTPAMAHKQPSSSEASVSQDSVNNISDHGDKSPKQKRNILSRIFSAAIPKIWKRI